MKKHLSLAIVLGGTVLGGVNLAFAQTTNQAGEVVEKISDKQAILDGKFYKITYEDDYLDAKGNVAFKTSRESILSAGSGELDTTPVKVQTITNKYLTMLVPSGTLDDSMKKIAKSGNIVRILEVNGTPIGDSKYSSLDGYHFNLNGSLFDTPFTYEDSDRVTEIMNYKSDHPFKDVNGRWSDGIIYTLADVGVVAGVGDGKFAPDDAVTRAEFFKMLEGVAEKKGFSMNKTEDTPTDMKDASWAKTYVQKVKGYIDAAAAGAFDGILNSSNKLQPNIPITRGEAAQIMSFFVDKKDAGTWLFSDWNGGYEQTQVSALVADGIIGGTGGGKFDPSSTLTREQMAAMIERLFYTN